MGLDDRSMSSTEEIRVAMVSIVLLLFCLLLLLNGYSLPITDDAVCSGAYCVEHNTKCRCR